MKKKILAGILVILVLAVLVGCEHDPEPTPSPYDWSKITDYQSSDSDRVLGTASAALVGTDGRFKETVLGNFIMDGIAEYARYITGEKIDFALHNGQNLKVFTLSEGNITNADILGLLGSDVLIIGDYTGTHIKNLINILVNSNTSSTWKANCAVMVSKEVTYDITTSDPDSEPPTAANIKVNGKPIDEDKTYRVATGNFLAGRNADGTEATSGGGAQIKNNVGMAGNPTSQNPTTLAQSLAMYVLAKGTINPSDYPLGRISGVVPAIQSAP